MVAAAPVVAPSVAAVPSEPAVPVTSEAMPVTAVAVRGAPTRSAVQPISRGDQEIALERVRVSEVRPLALRRR